MVPTQSAEWVPDPPVMLESDRMTEDESDKAAIVLSHQMVAQFDSILLAEPITTERMAAAAGAVAGLAATIISLFPPDLQEDCFHQIVAGIHRQLDRINQKEIVIN